MRLVLETHVPVGVVVVQGETSHVNLGLRHLNHADVEVFLSLLTLHVLLLVVGGDVLELWLGLLLLRGLLRCRDLV